MSKWFKGYFISSTYAQDIRNQSCITNRETPCSKQTYKGRLCEFADKGGGGKKSENFADVIYGSPQTGPPAPDPTDNLSGAFSGLIRAP